MEAPVGRKVYFGSQFEGMVHQDREARAPGPEGTGCIISTVKNGTENLRIPPVLGMVLSTFRVGLLFSLHPISKLLHRHAQRFVAMVILDSNQLTIKISDCSLLHVFYPL